MRHLERAIILAVQAHAGQASQDGEPYVMHPLRVMLRFTDEPTRIVALLHDAVEDTALTLADLSAQGFTPDVVQAVDAISRRRDEPYPAYMDRVAANPLAARVKLADLEDNADLIHTLAPDRAKLWRERYAEYIPRFRAIAGKASAPGHGQALGHLDGPGRTPDGHFELE